MELSEIEVRIMDSPDFQRLRGIKQLATAYLVYPGANHTRFEHSLGTLHLASRISKRLGLGKEDAVKARLYALLHDIGHSAFSHEAEWVTSKFLGSHEEIGKKIIMGGQIGDIISESLSKREIADFQKSPNSKIITSDIGADRMDYLKRDAHYTGVAYGVIDEGRIIEKMYMEKGGLGVESGALETSESLLIARFMMFSTVYFHHTVRIASAMLVRSLESAFSSGEMEPGEMVSQGDSEILSRLSKIKDAGFYASAIIDRRLYKEAHSFPRSSDSLGVFSMEEKKRAEIASEISSISGCEVLLDVPRDFSRACQFKVKMHDEEEIEISEVSELVRALDSAENSRKRALLLCPKENREKVARACRQYFGS